MSRTGRRRGLRLAVTAAVVLALLLLLPSAFFLYRTFSIESAPGVTDAIVVLTGGRGRVEEGFRMLVKGEGRLLVLLGVSPSVTPQDLFGNRLRGIDPQRIILEKGSRTTIENALFGRRVLQEQGVGSIRLITSRYHMVRSLLLFERLLPPGIRIIPHPVENRQMSSWRSLDPAAGRLLWSEMYKYWMYRLFFLFVPDYESAG